MGYTVTPSTPAAMAELEALMARPLPARGAGAKLAGLLDDDTLHDMLDAAGHARPGADVRPILALSLDEFVNWVHHAHWPEDLRERGRALVEQFRESDIGAHAGRLVMPDTEAAALAQVADILGLGASAVASRLDACRGTAPGTHAVRDAATGEIYRVEAVYGVVFGADEPARERLATVLFGPGAGPAP